MSSDNLHVLVGLGISSLSVARYLSENKIPFALIDTREAPPHLEKFKTLYPDAEVSLGSLNETFLNKAAKLIVSPGIATTTPAIANQIKKGTPVVGDIEIFAEAIDKPVIAITGTNAKSTVTTLVAEMAKQAGKKAKAGGNLGIPALDLIADDMDLYVLELSSFQLETMYSLAPQVATILNITPDHMDRYGTLEAYTKAKQRIYSNCHIAISNKDDKATNPHQKFSQKHFHFTLLQPQENEFGLLEKDNEIYLAFEDKLLLPTHELPILGKHYQANALAGLAIGYAYGLPFDAMLQTLREFKGLRHRCELVREINNVRWYNDSKGTNVGATLAAIEGLGPEISGKIILIAGGVGKGADFSALAPAIEKYVRHVVLIGEAAPLLAKTFGKLATISFAKDMQEAVEQASKAAQPQDCVLLSPACASFDMFKNFEHRGDVFVSCVETLKGN